MVDRGNEHAPLTFLAPCFFIMVAFGVSWLFWIPAALSGQGTDTFLASTLVYLGGTGPPLAGFFLTYLTLRKEGRRDYWKRIFWLKRIGVGWYSVILLIIPFLTILAILLDILTGGSGAQFETIARFLTRPRI